MTKSGKALRPTRPKVDPPTIAKARSPADVAVMIPYLLGFQPHESLVVVALQGPRRRFGPMLRVDLAEDAVMLDAQAEQVLQVVQRHRTSRVLVVAYSERPSRADPVVSRILADFEQSGIDVEEALRADGARWWSYTCTNRSCCRPEGMAYDPSTSRMATEAIVAGLSYASDREALRARFAHDDERIRAEVAASLEQGSLQGRRRPTDSVAISALVSAELADPRALTAAATAELARSVQSMSGLEAAVLLPDRTTAEQHFELWRTVMCRIPDQLVPFVGSVAAFCAWLDGHGVLAWHALDAVYAIAPTFPPARSIEGLLRNAVNPNLWPFTAATSPTSAQ